jgi:hypothetical protein
MKELSSTACSHFFETMIVFLNGSDDPRVKLEAAPEGEGVSAHACAPAMAKIRHDQIFSPALQSATFANRSRQPANLSLLSQLPISRFASHLLNLCPCPAPVSGIELCQLRGRECHICVSDSIEDFGRTP